MSIVSEFKEFAVKGNAMDLAVGVIIGAAFGKIVESIVNDLIMPIVGAVFGGFDFSNLFVALGAVPEGVAMTLAEVKKAGVPVFAFGSLILRFAQNDRLRPMSKQYYVYIMASRSHVLYLGVTNDLRRRVEQHRQKVVEGFTQKYNVTRLVYYESTNDVQIALNREKEIKGWLRKKKITLLESVNPQWKDLSEDRK